LQIAPLISFLSGKGNKNHKRHDSFVALLFPKRKPFETAPVGSRGMKAHEIIARIYGVPVQQVLPEIDESRILPLSNGQYSQVTHDIQISSEVADKNRMKDHELLHSAQFLLQPLQIRKYLDFAIKQNNGERMTIFSKGVLAGEVLNRAERVAFSEPTAYTMAKRPLVDSLRSLTWRPTPLVGLEATLAGGLLLNPPLFFSGSALIAYSAALQAARHLAAKRFYNRHGVGGLCLLFSHPPAGIDSLLIPLKERHFLKNGLLAKQGGLTAKGEQAILKAVPKEELLRRLEVARKMRLRARARD